VTFVSYQLLSGNLQVPSNYSGTITGSTLTIPTTTTNGVVTGNIVATFDPLQPLKPATQALEIPAGQQWTMQPGDVLGVHAETSAGANAYQHLPSESDTDAVLQVQLLQAAAAAPKQFVSGGASSSDLYRVESSLRRQYPLTFKIVAAPESVAG